MVQIAVQESHGHWFGIVFEGTGLVATAIGATRDQAHRLVLRCLSAAVHAEPLDEARPGSSTDFVVATAAMLGRLESGDESRKRFTLSADHLSERLRNVLYTAAAIPLGYVTSYGEIARVAGSEARAVGRTMATNPLYPVVPCHRVVGADLRMVGYGGRQDDAARQAKLGRLKAEARSYTEDRRIEVVGGQLRVHPVEWAIAAERNVSPDDSQLWLFV